MFSLSDLQPFSPQAIPLIIILFLISTTTTAAITAIINNVFHKKNGFNEMFLFKMEIPAWLICLLLTLILFIFLLYISEKNRKAPVLSAHTQDSPASQEKFNDQNVWKRLTDNKSEWDLTEMDKLSEETYCPHIYNGNFVYRTLWYRSYIPAVFSKIRLRFIVIKLGENNIPSKALIQFGDVYGKNYNVANLYVPFDKIRGVNFESYDSKNNSLSFQNNAGSLPLPIKFGSTITVTVSTTNVVDIHG